MPPSSRISRPRLDRFSQQCACFRQQMQFEVGTWTELTFDICEMCGIWKLFVYCCARFPDSASAAGIITLRQLTN